MSYKTFTSIDELLEHVKANLKETEGKFAVGESVDFFEQLEKKTSDHKKSITEKEALEKRARESETKLKELEPKIVEYETEIEHLKTINPPNEKIAELSDRLKKEATSRMELESKNCDLAEQVSKLAEIEQKLGEMTTREQHRIIMGEIRKVGTELKIPQTILGDDVLLERLFTPDLKYDEATGKVFADGDVSVKNYLLSKQQEKPDILEPRSGGSGGGPGQSQSKPDSFQEASERYIKDPRKSGLGGIADMISAAPTKILE